jgi:hypothetical protein
MNFYILQNNETQGPYTMGQIRSMWDSGAIASEALFCREGDSAWQPLKHELELPPAAASSSEAAAQTTQTQPKDKPPTILKRTLTILFSTVTVICLGIVINAFVKNAVTPTIWGIIVIGLTALLCWVVWIWPSKDPERICTNCGHVGKPVSLTSGSFVMEIALWCFFLMPGLLYSLWRMTTRKQSCPKCKDVSRPMVMKDTPVGRSFLDRQR